MGHNSRERKKNRKKPEKVHTYASTDAKQSET